MPPGHSHSEGCGCSDVSKAQNDPNIIDLFDVIDIDKIWCLNERKSGMGKNIIKPYSEKDNNKILLSDEYDGDLILHIPFITQVKLRSFCIMGKNIQEYPHHVKFWINRDNITFNNCNRTKVTQQFDLDIDQEAKYFYPTTLYKFQNVSNITLFFDGSNRAATRIDYICLKGISTKHKKQVVTAVYEARALTKDHKNKQEDHVSSSIF